MQRVSWWRPVALAAVAVPAIFLLTKERSSDAAAVESAERAQELSSAIRGLGLESSQLGAVRCRATLCRIEVSHGSFEAEQKFVARIGELAAFRDAEGFVERVPRSDGSIATTMFVSRSGHRLPDLPADWADSTQGSD
jgi:hypothetical protein